MGTKASIVMTGEWSPTAATMRPSVAAMLYAGAVEESPMTTEENSPSAPALSPFSPGPGPSASGAADSAVSPESFTPDHFPGSRRGLPERLRSGRAAALRQRPAQGVAALRQPRHKASRRY